MKGSFVFIIALVIGLLTAVLVNKQLNSERNKIHEGWQPVAVCVARHTLTNGQSIDVELDLARMDVPKSVARLPDYVTWTDRETLQNQFVNTSIEAGKLLDRRFLGRKNRNSNAVTLTPERGRRLIAIKVNEVTGTAGHLRPGDKVDILHTSGDLVTQLILQNITIKHTGRPQRSRNRQNLYTTLTLEVSVRESMILANAAATGTLTTIKRRGSGGPVDPEEARPIRPGDYAKQQ
jgi:pilus assembly protein CpaB